jgi:hypothetical protein
LLETRRSVLKSIRIILEIWRRPDSSPGIKQFCVETLKAQLTPDMPYSAMALDTYAFEAPELLMT